MSCACVRLEAMCNARADGFANSAQQILVDAWRVLLVTFNLNTGILLEQFAS
jgi:hypothetical protein